MDTAWGSVGGGGGFGLRRGGEAVAAAATARWMGRGDPTRGQDETRRGQGYPLTIVRFSLF